MKQQVTTQHYSESQISSIATHKVLRNTYMLLSMTLLFSAAMTVLSIMINMPRLPMLLQIGVMFGLLILVQATSKSAFGLVSVFLFTGFMGLTLGPTISFYLKSVANGGQVIAMALSTTGITFVGLSAYVLTTKKDFSFMGSFLFAGLLAVIVISIAGWLFSLPISSVMISGVVALLMCGFILYDTSRIIHGGETNYITATVNLYLDILNLFLALLNIFGNNK